MPKRPEPEPADERLAATIVATVTGCATKRLDLGGVQRPDYALFDAAGEQIGVLEVTMATSPAHSSFFSTRAGEHRFWEDPNLRRSWLATVDRPTRSLRTLREPLTAVLPTLEAQGITFATTHPENFRGQMASMPAQLARVGVVELNVIDPDPVGVAAVAINLMPEGGPYGVESATEAIEVELRKADNRTKLNRPFPRRELFVWVAPPSAAASALGTYSLEPWPAHVTASRPPRLPDEVTAVWAALFPLDERYLAMALWRGDRDGWRVIEPPAAF